LTAQANELLEKANIEPEIHEIVNQKVFTKNCGEAKICTLLFVPSIYESSAEQRKQYLAEFMEVAKKNRKNPVVYFWLAAGDQLDLERKLNLGFGYPAVLAVSRTKNVVATMRSSFSVQNTNEFITKVMTGSAAVSPLPQGGLEFKKVAAWDGKDAPVIEEEPLDYDPADL